MKRTNVVIDERKLKAAKKAYDIETTREIVDLALAELLRTRDKKQILKLKGKVKLDLDLDEIRKAE